MAMPDLTSATAEALAGRLLELQLHCQEMDDVRPAPGQGLGRSHVLAPQLQDAGRLQVEHPVAPGGPAGASWHRGGGVRGQHVAAAVAGGSADCAHDGLLLWWDWLLLRCLIVRLLLLCWLVPVLKGQRRRQGDRQLLLA